MTIKGLGQRVRLGTRFIVYKLYIHDMSHVPTWCYKGTRALCGQDSKPNLLRGLWQDLI